MSNFIDILPEEVVGSNISSYLGPRTLNVLRGRNEYQEESFRRAAVRDPLEGINIAFDTDDADLLQLIVTNNPNYADIYLDDDAKRKAKDRPGMKIGMVIDVLTRRGTRSPRQIFWTNMLNRAISQGDPNIAQLILDQYIQYIDLRIAIYEQSLDFLANNRQLLEPLSNLKLILNLSSPQEYMILLQLFVDATDKIPALVYDDAWQYFLGMVPPVGPLSIKNIITDEMDDYIRFLLDAKQYVQ